MLTDKFPPPNIPGVYAFFYNGLIKIGHSKCLRTRLKSHRYLYPKTLPGEENKNWKIIGWVETEKNDTELFERRLIELFYDNLYYSKEWFLMDEESMENLNLLFSLTCSQLEDVFTLESRKRQATYRYKNTKSRGGAKNKRAKAALEFIREHLLMGFSNTQVETLLKISPRFTGTPSWYSTKKAVYRQRSLMYQANKLVKTATNGRPRKMAA